MKRCVCIDALYTELPFAERIKKARMDGFDAVEFWDWRNKNLKEIKHTCEETGIPVLGFNGDAEISLIDPATAVEYIAYINKSVLTAKYLNADCITIHSNGLGENGRVIRSYDELSDTVKICTMFQTLLTCAKIAEDNGITMNLEALNTTVDHVGNFLKSTQMAAEMIRLIHSPNMKVLFDVYHMKMNGECVVDTIQKYGDTFGHIHVADAPGRHEPGTGEIYYPGVYSALRDIAYKGYVGYELFAQESTEDAVKAIMTVG